MSLLQIFKHLDIKKVGFFFFWYQDENTFNPTFIELKDTQYPNLSSLLVNYQKYHHLLLTWSCVSISEPIFLPFILDIFFAVIFIYAYLSKNKFL